MNAYYEASRGGGYPQHPGHKREGTSKDAADGIAPRAKSLRMRVFDALKTRPNSPEGLSDILGEPVHSLRPRFSELSARNLIEDSGARGVAMGGRPCIIWRVK